MDHVKEEEDKLWKLDDIIEDIEEESRSFLINLENDDRGSDESIMAEELN